MSRRCIGASSVARRPRQPDFLSTSRPSGIERGLSDHSYRFPHCPPRMGGHCLAGADGLPEAGLAVPKPLLDIAEASLG